MTWSLLIGTICQQFPQNVGFENIFMNSCVISCLTTPRAVPLLLYKTFHCGCRLLNFMVKKIKTKVFIHFSKHAQRTPCQPSHFRCLVVYSALPSLSIYAYCCCGTICTPLLCSGRPMHTRLTPGFVMKTRSSRAGRWLCSITHFSFCQSTSQDHAELPTIVSGSSIVLRSL